MINKLLRFRLALRAHLSLQSLCAFCSCMELHLGLFPSRPCRILCTLGLGLPFSSPRLTCRHSDSSARRSLTPRSKGSVDTSSRVSPFSKLWHRKPSSTRISRPVGLNCLELWHCCFSAVWKRKRTGMGMEATQDGRWVKMNERTWMVRLMAGTERDIYEKIIIFYIHTLFEYSEQRISLVLMSLVQKNE